MKFRQFKLAKQFDAMDCGPACLRMIAKNLGLKYTLAYLRDISYINKNGVNMHGISCAAEKIGFRTLCVKVDRDLLAEEAPLPCILHWNQNHFVVLYKIVKNRYYIADPSIGKLSFYQEEFSQRWSSDSKEGIALLLEPTIQIFNQINSGTNKVGFNFILKYFTPYKFAIFQVLLSMLLASGLSLALPYLTKNMIDKGLVLKNTNFILLILLAQVFVFLGNLGISIVKSKLMLYVNGKVNMELVSDFLLKLMRLPIKYFDSKVVGDIRQRISDHSRVQTFFTSTALNIIFSVLNLVVFTVVLLNYSIKITLVFFVLSILSIFWNVIFLAQRKSLDYMNFEARSQSENILFEIVTGMQEIKLNNAESIKHIRWLDNQKKLFLINLKGQQISQWQQIGTQGINQSKNILISYLCAVAVVKNEISLGMMMSVSYIIGQLSEPIQSFREFIQLFQDATISLERLHEIHGRKDEDLELLSPSAVPVVSDNKINCSQTSGIQIQNLSFRYDGPGAPLVINNVSFVIPKGKTTAIVGTSGSGKTTLMKILLKYYQPTEGLILIDGENINSLNSSLWRSKCGVVMQDGYIFSDTIEGNISMDHKKVDINRFNNSIRIANITDFILNLPMGQEMMIGSSGSGISGGQKQRILIARALYKEPDYIFFDEATSSLDSNNEKQITTELQKYLNGKTAIIIAHRLSTVKNADQILVLEAGEIVESGTHSQLVKLKEKYFELIKNQLELAD